MSKTKTILLLTCLINTILQEKNDPTSPIPDELAKMIKLSDSIAQKKSALIKSSNKTKCNGLCYYMSMNLPTNSHWNDPKGKYPWYPSHGSPTVSHNNIWMWSRFHGKTSYGEGINLKHYFHKGRKYCIDTLFRFTSENPPS